MRFHRFLVETDLSSPAVVLTDSGVVHQLGHVLRVKPGERIILMDGENHEVVARITDIQKNGIAAIIEERSDNTNEPEISVSLYAAILKQDKFSWVVQKATEIGVQQIIPVITHRTIKLGLNHFRLETVMKEAAEQSGRGVMPTLHESMKLKDAVQHAHTSDKKIFFDIDGTPIRKILKEKNKKSIAVFIGPEGGFAEEEKSVMNDVGFTRATLGPLTFRAETAAIIAAYECIYSV